MPVSTSDDLAGSNRMIDLSDNIEVFIQTERAAVVSQIRADPHDTECAE